MSKQMLTLKLDPKEATLEKVCKKLNLSATDIDSDFGVVNIDPKRHLYAILVEEGLATGMNSQPDVSGPYSNPRIEPFGPPKDKEKE